MVVKFEGGRLLTNIGKIDTRTRAFIYAACKLHARRAVTYARKNAPWTDRTSNARNGLVGAVFRDGDKFGVIVAGSVDYQIWLETRWSGKFAIIRPTLDYTAPRLMKTIQAGWATAVGGAG